MVSGTPATADPELHVVGVYQGPRSMMTRKVSREVRVTLDRPGADVVLVLSSFAGVDWLVTLRDGTAPPSLVISQIDSQDPESTIRLNGTLVTDARHLTLPLTYRPEGDDFRDLVALVPDRFGVARMASYNGSYDAPEEPFVIDRVVADDRFDADYLRPRLAAGLLPDSLRRLLPPVVDGPVAPVTLTEQGFVLTDPAGQTRTIPLSPQMPDVSWPVAALRDEASGVLYGVTLGGDGLTYAYDERKMAWRILRSLGGLDASGMILDSVGNRLLLPVTKHARPVALVSHDLSGPDTGPLTEIADLSDLPGLTDLYDPGNGPAPEIVPAGLEGEVLLLTATGPILIRRSPASGPQRWRAYVLDLPTGRIDLVGYEGGIADP